MICARCESVISRLCLLLPSVTLPAIKKEGTHRSVERGGGGWYVTPDHNNESVEAGEIKCKHISVHGMEQQHQIAAAVPPF